MHTALQSHGTRLEPFLWASGSLAAAVLTRKGLVLAANPTLERLAGGTVPGRSLPDLVVPAQRPAVADRVAGAGTTWRRAAVAFAPAGGEGADAWLWLRGDGERVLAVLEPATAELARLVEHVLALNDELIGARRREARVARGEAEAARAARVVAVLRALAEESGAPGRGPGRDERILTALRDGLGLGEVTAYAVEADGEVVRAAPSLHAVAGGEAAPAMASLRSAAGRLAFGEGTRLVRDPVVLRTLAPRAAAAGVRALAVVGGPPDATGRRVVLHASARDRAALHPDALAALHAGAALLVLGAPGSYRATLQATRSAAREARRFLRGTLPALAGRDVLLALSELVNQAVLNGTEGELELAATVDRTAGRLRLEVGEPPRPPGPAEAGGADALSAQLVDDAARAWGVRRTAGRTTRWAELAVA